MFIVDYDDFTIGIKLFVWISIEHLEIILDIKLEYKWHLLQLSLVKTLQREVLLVCMNHHIYLYLHDIYNIFFF